jgi:HSP20 family protein
MATVRYVRRNYRYEVVTGGERPRSAIEWWTLAGTVVLAPSAWRPRADVYESDAAIVVAIELAGVRPRDVDVQLFADALLVQGSRPVPSGIGRGRYHAAGIPRGPFRLTLALPSEIDPDRAEARLEAGQLELVLPKREAATDGR